MKKVVWSIGLMIALAVTLNAQEQKNVQEQKIAQLKKEIEALKSLKLDKSDELEKKEADRWNTRYKQNIQSKEFEDKTRMLESQYTKIASAVSIKKDELQRYIRFTEEENEKLKAVESQSEEFKIELSQIIEKQALELSSDLPLAVTERTALLSQAATAAESQTRIHEAVAYYFSERLLRYGLSLSQELTQQNSIIEGVADVPVKQLRLGTVFFAEMEIGDKNRVQALLRTGNLQGKVYAWRSNLEERFRSAISSAITAAVENKSEAVIPMDVLQNKSLGRGFTQDVEVGYWQSFTSFFKKGGIVMYPLFACAFFALLLAFERLVLYRRRGRAAERLMESVRPMIRKKDWSGVKSVCAKSTSSLSCVIFAIMNSVEGSRDGAEKAVKENLLKEFPELEKRLGLVAALGASAPLLGLLGTVSGMITLFMVITDVGTNDPKILAGGISEALITTETGLVIAIPVLLIHSYLTEKLESITSSIQGYSLEILNKIWPDSRSEI